MTWTKKQELDFAELLFSIAQMYDRNITKRGVELYCRLVEDLPFEAVRSAMHQHITTSKFWPLPADIRVIALGNVEEQAELAWAHVRREVRRVGWMGKPEWPDEQTERAAMQLYGGWQALCENLPASGPEMLGTAKLFKAYFVSASRQHKRDVLQATQADAKRVLEDLKTELEKRNLPTKGLD
jgi:hypothetical protein